jgi:acyl dehydratase
VTSETSWSVDEQRQTAFVDLSGDRNPLHVDRIVARRLPFGRVAVHGVPLLLDALDRIAAETDGWPRHIRCTFRHPVGVGDTIDTTIDASDPNDLKATVAVDVWTAADVHVELGEPLPKITATPPPPDVTEPEVHTLDQLAGLSGEIDIAADTAAATALFPRLSARIGPARVAELITLTRLVGMQAPGLHSIFSRLDLTLRDDSDRERLSYEAAKADERFSQVTIDIAGPATAGTIVAFVRPAPVEQVLGDVRPEPSEFAGQRWLVVGGSRGLGAATVQLLAAGGADVRFTYRAGADDAARIEQDTGARAAQLDVLEPALGDVTADGWQPTHLAYLASPPIFEGMGGVYSDALYQRFSDVYVDAFTRIVAQLDPGQLVGILWPSSEAVDHDVAGLAEYADAKRAGEQACRDLAATHHGLTVHAPRLPRLLTDQSTSFVPTEYGDTAIEMLAALRGVTG